MLMGVEGVLGHSVKVQFEVFAEPVPYMSFRAVLVYPSPVPGWSLYWSGFRVSDSPVSVHPSAQLYVLENGMNVYDYKLDVMIDGMRRLSEMERRSESESRLR
jgi:hypothetical protein